MKFNNISKQQYILNSILQKNWSTKKQHTFANMLLLSATMDALSMDFSSNQCQKLCLKNYPRAQKDIMTFSWRFVSQLVTTDAGNPQCILSWSSKCIWPTTDRWYHLGHIRTASKCHNSLNFNRNMRWFFLKFASSKNVSVETKLVPVSLFV